VIEMRALSAHRSSDVMGEGSISSATNSIAVAAFDQAEQQA
jgi:hypothetical protein